MRRETEMKLSANLVTGGVVQIPFSDWETLVESISTIVYDESIFRTILYRIFKIVGQHTLRKNVRYISVLEISRGHVDFLIHFQFEFNINTMCIPFYISKIKDESLTSELILERLNDLSRANSVERQLFLKELESIKTRRWGR